MINEMLKRVIAQFASVQLLVSCTNTMLRVALLKLSGRNWSGEVVSFFLEDWEFEQVALSCHMTCCARKWKERAAEGSSHRGRAATVRVWLRWAQCTGVVKIQQVEKFSVR